MTTRRRFRLFAMVLLCTALSGCCFHGGWSGYGYGWGYSCVSPCHSHAHHCR